MELLSYVVLYRSLVSLTLIMFNVGDSICDIYHQYVSEKVSVCVSEIPRPVPPLSRSHLRVNTKPICLHYRLRNP